MKVGAPTFLEALHSSAKASSNLTTKLQLNIAKSINSLNT